MSVCDVRYFNEMGKFGYVAILDTFTRGKRNCIKYLGNAFGYSFSKITLQELAQFHIKTVRSYKEFGKYIKRLNSSFMVNPIKVGSLTIDLPFIYCNSIPIANWEPVFEKDVSKNSFNIISEGVIVEYNFQQPIYISVLDAKRHIPKINSERLLINQVSGLITRYISKADTNKYFEASYRLSGNKWVCDNFNQFAIAGYKLR